MSLTEMLIEELVTPTLSSSFQGSLQTRQIASEMLQVPTHYTSATNCSAQGSAKIATKFYQDCV